jgi:DNA-binding response OmpR family regulator
MTRVLLAEDDEAIAEPLARALRREGYEVEVRGDGQEALDVALQGVDLVVLDLGLPTLDGLDVCRRLRVSGSSVPVLILTARTDEVDTVVGLDAGADDYVKKPFRLAELLARARALLRRGAPEPESAPPLLIDQESRRVFLRGQEVALTGKEYALLSVLYRERGKVVSRDQLMHEIWDTEWYGSTKTLDVHVSVLRRKLDEAGDAGRMIATVRGVGFRLDLDG